MVEMPPDGCGEPSASFRHLSDVRLPGPNHQSLPDPLPREEKGISEQPTDIIPTHLILTLYLSKLL